MPMVKIIYRCLALALAVTAGTIWLPTPASAEITTDQPATATAVAVTTTPPTTDETLPRGYAEALQTAVDRAFAAPTEYAMPYVANDALIVPVSTAASSTTVATANQDIAVTPAATVTYTDDPNTPSTEPDKSTLDPTEGTGGDDTFSTMSADVIVEPVVYYVPHTVATLTAAQEEVLTLTDAELPGAGNLRTATIDPANDRVVIEAATVTQEMREALAARYGSTRVALQITPSLALPSWKATRQHDTPPYYGGAYIESSVGSCTAAFAWTHQGVSYLLTAGHCTSLHGYVNNNDTTLGTVSADNWNNTTGSVKLSGLDYYSGDASTVRLYDTSYGRVYKGSASSSTSRAVTSRYDRRSLVGDTYCVSGMRTGEMCGWRVVATYMTVKYSDGSVLRNATRGYRYGTCTKGGDSGAPIYRIKSDGTIQAKGILSGGSTNTSGDCLDYFTDTYLAEKALPGIIKLGS
jgi:V8-like Glu-specific endopeptidase